MRNGIAARVVNKVSEKTGAATIVELIDNNEVDLVINTPSGRSATIDGHEIRTAAVAADKPLFTTMAQVSAAVASLDVSREGFDVTSLQEYAIERSKKLASL
jgi:carbamoyl-phosphate synthase large subunit